MKTCPKCNELLGENVDRCFKCGHVFTNGKSVKRQNKVCPNCKKIFYNTTYENCTECGSILATYSEQARKMEEKNNSGGKSAADKFGLTDLDAIDLKSVNWIDHELFGNGVIEFASIFSGAKNSELVMMSCLRALVEQNWVLIRQLNKINKQLEEITKNADN